ncbi:Hypothetical predicted protein [Mytilus galloprovincialis]|uniref:Uncharacterized protein n=1 Tax=Mytilus galloprovincialis TaxID=29158 RepID=A0A8B6GDQ6_MYTGA|nr:Hypothetical predicted protein [Mytilus galloprovincialis]
METGINRQRIFKLPYGHFDAKSISFFPYLLRGLGLRIMNKLNSTLTEQREQFIISAIVSYKEIACRNTEVIREAEGEWECLDLDSLRFDHYSFSFNRLVFILNHPNPCIHGEARLLDPDGKTRRQIFDRPYQEQIGKESSNNFLAVMKEQFFKQFGENEKYVLVMFSHYIPCTLPGHMCAELLSEYATRYDEQILIGYTNVYKETNQNLSFRLMNKSDNIHCIKHKDLKLNCRKNAKETRHEADGDSDILETYLFDDEDYPNFKRMVKRFRNRSSKLKNRNREIKKRISKYLDMDYISGDRDDDSDIDVNFVHF